MVALPIADFGQIPMSSSLAQTLARASDAAGAAGFSEVLLEHLLSALCDDPDAAAVLDASHVDMGRIKAETAEYLARSIRPGMGPAAELTVSPVVKRILEAAAAAALGGRRKDISGAIVLAAIVGDGRSAASQMLQAQGLTFDEAIRALQSALNQPARDFGAGPLAAEDVLARARERVQSRSAPTLRDIMLDMPRPAAPPPPPPQPAPVGEPEAGAIARAAPATAAVTPVPQQPVAAEAKVPADGVGERSPLPASPPPVAIPHSDAAPHPVAAPPPPANAPVLPPANVPAPPPAAAVPLPQAPASPPQGGGYVYPTGQPMGRPAPPQPPMPSQPPPFDPSGAFDLSRRPGPRPPPIPPPMPLPGTAGGGAPALNKTLSAPSIAFPSLDRRPPPSARAPMTIPAPQAPAAPRRDAAPKADIGQLAENIPRAMRVANTERIEVRIAKAHVKAITSGLEGGGLAWRHDVTVTQAMSVRLRAPDGGFFIETASPETQWIENQLGVMAGDEFASWRFLVTPQRRGRARLQIIVSARTVGGDGLAAETALPDQIIEVKVRTNLKRMFVRWSGWILAAVAGGALAKFGEGAFGMAASLAQEIMKKYMN